VSLKGAKAVLVNVTGGLDMTLLEVDEAANAISDQVDPEANIIFGAAFDPSLDGKIRVSVVATGMDGASISAIEPKPIRAPASTPPLRINEREPVAATAQPTLQPAPQPAYRPAAQRPLIDEPVARVEPRPEPVEIAPEVLAAAQSMAAETERAAESDLYVARAPEAPNWDTPRAPEVQRAPAIERPAARAEPAMDDAPLFPDRHFAEERPKGGFFSLFGGGRARHEAPPPPLKDYRNDPSPVLQARAAAAQAAPKIEEEPAPESADDLEIPSFLRRLAN
jgi:cell division protein FtsZ